MNTIPSVRAFLQAIFTNWFTGMSGPVSVPLGISAYFVSNDTAKILLSITAISCAGFTAYWIWKAERQKVIELQSKIQKLSTPIITEDSYAGMEVNYRTGPVAKRTKVPFPQGIRALLVEPFGTGSIKVTIDAPNDAVAEAWLEQEESAEWGVQYRRIQVGDPLEERKWFFSSEIRRIDILGDSTITDVKVRVA